VNTFPPSLVDKCFRGLVLLGVTVRYESETECQQFLEQGEVANEYRNDVDGHEATGATRHE
jgi:hypothetical protein